MVTPACLDSRLPLYIFVYHGLKYHSFRWDNTTDTLAAGHTFLRIPLYLIQAQPAHYFSSSVRYIDDLPRERFTLNFILYRFPICS